MPDCKNCPFKHDCELKSAVTYRASGDFRDDVMRARRKRREERRARKARGAAKAKARAEFDAAFSAIVAHNILHELTPQQPQLLEVVLEQTIQHSAT